MSYILDALKKAERERGMNQVPTLSTVHDIDEKPAGRIWFYSIAAFAILVVAVGTFLFIWSRGNRSAQESEMNYADQRIAPRMQTPANSDVSVRESGDSSARLNQGVRQGNKASSEPALRLSEEQAEMMS